MQDLLEKLQKAEMAYKENPANETFTPFMEAADELCRAIRAAQKAGNTVVFTGETYPRDYIIKPEYQIRPFNIDWLDYFDGTDDFNGFCVSAADKVEVHDGK